MTDHLEAMLETLRRPPRTLKPAPKLPPTVDPLGASVDAPTDPELFTHAAHGITLETPRHAVARCRWCGGRFVQLYAVQWICETEACARRQLQYAMFSVAEPQPGRSPWYYIPLPLQVDIETVAMANWKHSLIAGAVGTAKSHGARHLLYRFCQMIPGLRVLMLRNSYDALNKNHLQYMDDEADQVGGIYTGGNVRQMRFPHDDGPESIMFAGFCEHEKDISQHTGPEWDLVFADEGVLLLPKAINEIISRARGSKTAMEAKVRLGLGPRWARSIINTNPGGRAMMFLLDHYIRKSPDRDRYPNYDAAQFGSISSTLDDNPYLDENFEAENLRHLDASRYRQLRHGDWTAVAGQFFAFTDAHIIR